MSHWIYHPDHSAKIVDHVEYERLLDAGWYDSPGKFPIVAEAGLAKAARKPRAEKIVSDEIIEKETNHDENTVINTDEKLETNVIPKTVGKQKRQFIL